MNLLEALTNGFAELRAELKTAFATRAALENDLATARTSLEAAQSLRAAAEKARTELQGLYDSSVASVAALTTRAETAEAEVTRLKAEAKTAEERAAAIVAGQGLPIAKLPETASTGAATDSQQIQTLRAQILSSTDAKERFKLAQQIKAMKTAKSAK
jgi:chromosome segregation ATPase